MQKMNKAGIGPRSRSRNPSSCNFVCGPQLFLKQKLVLSKHWFSIHAVLSRQSLSCWHSPFWTIENLKGSFVIKTWKDKPLVIPRISFLKYFSLTFVTSIERISFKSWRTRARCFVVLHRANSRWTTWFIHYTRVYAASISTCLTGSAFKIGRAAYRFRLSWEIAKWDDKNRSCISNFRF